MLDLIFVILLFCLYSRVLFISSVMVCENNIIMGIVVNETLPPPKNGNRTGFLLFWIGLIQANIQYYYRLWAAYWQQHSNMSKGSWPVLVAFNLLQPVVSGQSGQHTTSMTFDPIKYIFARNCQTYLKLWRKYVIKPTLWQTWKREILVGKKIWGLCSKKKSQNIIYIQFVFVFF